MPRTRRSDRQELVTMVNLLADAYLRVPKIDDRSARSTGTWIDSLQRLRLMVDVRRTAGETLTGDLGRTLDVAVRSPTDRRIVRQQIDDLEALIESTMMTAVPREAFPVSWRELAHEALGTRRQWEVNDASAHAGRLSVQGDASLRGIFENEAIGEIISALVLNPTMDPAKRAAALLAIEHTRLLDQADTGAIEENLRRHKPAAHPDHDRGRGHGRGPAAVRERDERDAAASAIGSDVRALCRLGARWDGRDLRITERTASLDAMVANSPLKSVIPTTAQSRNGMHLSARADHPDYDSMRMLTSPADTTVGEFRAAKALLASCFDLARTTTDLHRHGGPNGIAAPSWEVEEEHRASLHTLIEHYYPAPPAAEPNDHQRARSNTPTSGTLPLARRATWDDGGGISNRATRTLTALTKSGAATFIDAPDLAASAPPDFT